MFEFNQINPMAQERARVIIELKGGTEANLYDYLYSEQGEIEEKK